MTELELYGAPHEVGGNVVDLVAWADSARAAHSIAESLVRTSFVPAAFKNKPEEATGAILSGLELGLSPMAALRSFDIIQGAATARAMTLRAVVQSAGHEMWTEESTPSRAVVCGRRQGASHDERSVWTMDRARNLQLTGKDNWKKQPQAMLLARATSECARLVAADAILGIPYSSEELTDLETEATTPAARAPEPAARRARRAAPETPEPSFEEGDGASAGPEMITAAQSKKMHAGMNEWGFTDRELGLRFISDAVGRVVETSKDLTKEEASRVIQRLEDMGAPEPDSAPDGGWPEVPEIPESSADDLGEGASS